MDSELLQHLTTVVLMYAPNRDQWGNDGWLAPIQLDHCEVSTRTARTGMLAVGREAEHGTVPEVTTTLICDADMDPEVAPRPGYRFVTIEDGTAYIASTVNAFYDEGELHHYEIDLTEEQ